MMRIFQEEAGQANLPYAEGAVRPQSFQKEPRVNYREYKKG